MFVIYGQNVRRKIKYCADYILPSDEPVKNMEILPKKCIIAEKLVSKTIDRNISILLTISHFDNNCYYSSRVIGTAVPVDVLAYKEVTFGSVLPKIINCTPPNAKLKSILL
ncbi:hypothetical protein KQX54_016509 [Cotesia glomerata]|uniref:Uncharacterized protein n=1 Tax=Cotesia glomerata TaxID=32391 RepID=A0AAV7I5J3_COTGL|nr:hypothetical protein KQX54_016509 [Cotesia glomerata]